MVLYVEDDADDREVFHEVITESFTTLRYIEATNGQECLDLLSGIAEYPKMIVVDINMPVMNGYELIRKLKTNDTYKNIPVVVLTTATAEAAPMAMRMGADKFYTKPTEIAEFRQVVHEMLSVLVK